MSREDAKLRKLTLLLALTRGRAGRYQLKGVLGLGEGVIRRGLAALAREGLAEASRTGTEITDRGRREIDRIAKELGLLAISLVDVGEVARNAWGVAAVVEGEATNVIGARDAAVREGCDGCLIATLKGGRIVFPPLWDFNVEEAYPSLAGQLSRLLRDGLIAAVAYANTLYPAVKGAYRAAMFLRKR